MNDDPIPPNEEIPRTAFMGNVGEVSMWGYEIETAYRTVFEHSGATLRFNIAYSRQMGEVEKLGDDVADALSRRALGADLIYMRPKQLKSQVVYKHPWDALGAVGGFAGATWVTSASYVYESGGYWGLGEAGDALFAFGFGCAVGVAPDYGDHVQPRRWRGGIS